jgi:adenylate cyclase, class 2
MRVASKTGLRKSGRGNGDRANTEIEIKLRVTDDRGFLRRLGRLKAKPTRGRVHEMNTLYDTRDGNLARHGQMLRLRVERPAVRTNAANKVRKVAEKRSDIRAWLTFKGPVERRSGEPGPYKIREEREVRILDYEEMPRVFEALGLRPWFRYEKFRSTFRLPRIKGLQLMLDETPIGVFVELEGERGEIDRAAGLLGFGPSDYITKSYGALFMEELGLAARAFHNEPIPSSGLPDMVFDRRELQQDSLNG